MIQITMTEEDLELLFKGGEWFLGYEPGFDPWEQSTGRTKVLINGDIAEVFVEYSEPPCSCCAHDKSSGDWWITLTNARPNLRFKQRAS